MNDPRITPIAIVPFGIVNAFLLTTSHGAVLIDTGLPGAAPKIEVALTANGLTWADLRLIVVTHGHIDHAGSAARVRALSGAPILLHPADIPFCNGARKPVLRPTGLAARLFKATGVPLRDYRPFDPDLLAEDDGGDLTPYGLPGRTVFTPGHTPGSISVLLDDGTVFAADLLASGILLGGLILRNRAKRPPFEENPAQVAAALENLLALGGKTFHLGHGGPLDAPRVARHAARLRRLG